MFRHVSILHFIILISLMVAYFTLSLIRAQESSEHEDPSEEAAANRVNSSTESVKSQPSSDTINESPELIKFRQMYISKRHLQRSAIQKLIQQNDLTKLSKMLRLMIEKIFQVLQESQQKLVTGGVGVGDPLPENEDLKEAYAMMLENSAFLSDLALRFPDQVHPLVDPRADYKQQITWAISFCNASSVLHETDNQMLTLAAQELYVIQRREDFYNPFSRLNAQMESEKEPSSKVEKKRQKRKKGPRISQVKTDL